LSHWNAVYGGQDVRGFEDAVLRCSRVPDAVLSEGIKMLVSFISLIADLQEVEADPKRPWL
jgi:hypothetical protein